MYLSRYADTATPSYFLADQTMRLLICKVLPGRSKRLKPQASNAGWKLAPDPAFNSHVSSEKPQPEDPPHLRHRHSQVSGIPDLS